MERSRTVLLLLWVVISLMSCQSHIENLYKLIPDQDSLVFELNPQTSMLIKAMSLYTDVDGKEYLTFQNNVKPEILWYDLTSREHVKTLKLDKEGSNGVGLFCGYYLRSDDEIYIPEMMRPIIDVVNAKGEIIRKIPFEKTDAGKNTIPFVSASFPSTPIFMLDGTLYLPESINIALENPIEDSPVTLAVDTSGHSVKEFEIRFPKVLSKEELKGNTLGVECSYSVCYNNEDFIYAFAFDENLYVVSTDGKVKNILKAKSKYIDHVYNRKTSPSGMEEWTKLLCEIPMYGNLLYDPYREVYYRFVYPQTELGNENYRELWEFGRTKFSVMILDKDFNLLGETLFPENTYASNLFFIKKDGLYLSTSFVKNPNYSDDELCFRRIDLVRNENK